MMAKKHSRSQEHAFRDKLLLNQWILNLFGVNSLKENKLNGRITRPFHILSDPVKDPRLEGFQHDNLHGFFHELSHSPLFLHESCKISEEQLLYYEENIARHTRAINVKRRQPVAWKYYQWLSLLFVEIYLDRFFTDRTRLLGNLNEFVESFNHHWNDHADVPLYSDDDLNKICIQNATGSGKTLLMHVNLRQYRHYARKHGRGGELSRVILLTPNERLSEQHAAELKESDVLVNDFTRVGRDLLTQAEGLEQVDIVEITKLADQTGPNTLAVRSLGDQNLLLVDEGHRGMSGREEGVWFTRRSSLCAKGFVFEYSATFEQAVRASGNTDFENNYAKSVIFDYSYRWFYEDGFGKDYQILNLPASHEENQLIYTTACLLKFYQQLRIYEERSAEFANFNLEKPLWVFVGSTVSSGKRSKDEQTVVTDVGRIIKFIDDFLGNRQEAMRRMEKILTGRGRDTGLLDEHGNDIFDGAFTYLSQIMNDGGTMEVLYKDILTRLFQNSAGGTLSMDRLKGESGEIILRVGHSEKPFGLINVGDTKGLCEHVVEMAAKLGLHLTVEDSDFQEAIFTSVRHSASPINLLIGSKKFVEGWDCWRVSTMGLMHVGRSEGAQIIQLFGRGVRLKGYKWSLKRSDRSHAGISPDFIRELETLNVFGIKADFMDKFRQFLEAEGLPGNEQRRIIKVPLNVTYDFGKKLQILRPKRKASDGKEYNFKKDAATVTVGEIPDYMIGRPVVADWYPRIQVTQSWEADSVTKKDKVKLCEEHLSLLDWDALFFELEQFKRERSWHNLNISKKGIRTLLKNNDWYTLHFPEAQLRLENFKGVLLLQRVALDLLKRYCTHYYNYCERKYIEPRMELRELGPGDENIPREESYQLIVDGNEEQVIQGVQQLKYDLEKNKKDLLSVGDLKVCNFNRHLFHPLLHIPRGGKIDIFPVTLNESEFRFVTDLKNWYDANKSALKDKGSEIFLLRNMSRGKGVGFFEAGNFHPDFILWKIDGAKQYVSFIEPHGLVHEGGPASEKVQFYKTIKDIERRLNDPSIILNSFILSWTRYRLLKWSNTRDELEDMHVLFMQDDQKEYIDKLFNKLQASET